MAPPVELGVAIPQTAPGGPLDPGAIRRFVTRAEELGFGSLWVVDHQTVGTLPSLDAIEALTFAAAVTTRLRLGTAVLLTGLRSPIHLARTLASLDQLSRGRLIVGVGLGGERAWRLHGLPTARRAARFTEGLRLLQRLWTEARVTFEGEFWTLRDVVLEPKPFQRPHPPLWFGGHHPNALRRAVELGRGFMGAGSVSTATFVEQVRQLRRLQQEAGRDPATFGLGKRVYIAIDRDRDRAGRRLAEWFGGFYGKAALAAEVAVWGDVQECLDRLAEIVAGGARLLLLNPVFDPLEHLERFRSEIAPKL